MSSENSKKLVSVPPFIPCSEKNRSIFLSPSTCVHQHYHMQSDVKKTQQDSAMSSVRHSELHIISRGQQGKQKWIGCVWDRTCAFIITFQKNLQSSGQLRRKVSGPLPSNILTEYTHRHWGVHTTICWNMLSQQSDSEGVHQTTRESAREQQRDHYIRLHNS